MTTQMLVSANRLSDDVLLARVKEFAAREREATVALIAHLAELDRRRLYLAEGCSSLFTYCTEVLHLSEHAAYGRIEAARAARRFPVILEQLEEGSITLTTVCLLASLLTAENHQDVLDAARHKSKRQVEELVVRFRPLPPVTSLVRRLPAPRHTPSAHVLLNTCDGTRAETGTGTETAAVVNGADLASARPAVIAPLAPQRYKVQFTASAETYEKLRMAQALLRHQIPDGDPAAVFDRALTALLENLTKQKLSATNRPREHREGSSHSDDEDSRGPSRSRHIPAEVRREVWQRDGGQCAFVGPNGRRCTERGLLEFHHVVPYSMGGAATVRNIQLRCRAHNGYEAEVALGHKMRLQLGPDRVDFLTELKGGARM